MFENLDFLRDIEINTAVSSPSYALTGLSDVEKSKENLQETMTLANSLLELLLKGKFGLLKETWQVSSTYLVERYGMDTMKKIFTAIGDLSMDPLDHDWWQSLPEQVTLYRAGSEDGISWSTSLNVAEWHQDMTGREIISKQVSKSFIRAAYLGENEVIYFE